MQYGQCIDYEDSVIIVAVFIAEKAVFIKAEIDLWILVGLVGREHQFLWDSDQHLSTLDVFLCGHASIGKSIFERKGRESNFGVNRNSSRNKIIEIRSEGGVYFLLP